MNTSQAKLLFLHAITPVHSGTGQTAAVIDQPIAREKATGWPLIPASSLKGVLRDLVKANHGEDKAKEMFGDAEKAGPLVFGDQRILCLPVRSFFGTFAYLTCPLILKRLERDVRALSVTMPFTAKIPDNPSDTTTILLPEDNSVLVNGKVYLEDLDLTFEHRKGLGEIAAGLAEVLFAADAKEFTSRFAIVSDEVFNFLSETSTEVVARIAIGEEGTTSSKGGNLWYEEAVPAESIFCGPVLVADFYGDKTILEQFEKSIKPNQQQEGTKSPQPTTIQIGGNASVGRGLCRVLGL